LASEQIDAVIASDLHRAVQTAEYIAQPHHLEVSTTALMRERDWGSFTGRFIPDLKGEVWPDDIESEESLLLRARAFLLYIVATYPGKRVVAVGHGIFNKAVLAVYAKCPMREVQRMMNAEVRILTASAETTASAAVTSALASPAAVVPTAMASAKGTSTATTGSATAE
jgi:probable phosphoglycerate mutase